MAASPALPILLVPGPAPVRRGSLRKGYNGVIPPVRRA